MRDEKPVLSEETAAADDETKGIPPPQPTCARLRCGLVVSSVGRPSPKGYDKLLCGMYTSCAVQPTHFST